MADTTTNLVLTSELEAVNTLLRCIGEGPIADVDSPQNISAMNALKSLRRVSREVQARGWHFNTEYDVTLSLDGDSKLPVGTDILEVDTYGGDKSRDVTRRGGYLYDLDNNTYIFTTSLKVIQIRFLSFTDLPESARNYIVVKAGREFAMSEIGTDGSRFGFTEQDEVQALMSLKNHEGNNADHNILTDNFATASVLDRTGVYGDMVTYNSLGR